MEVSMNIFARMLERLGAQRVENRGMSVLHDGRTSLDKLEALARMTARAIHSDIKFAPPGKRLNIVTTSDFDEKGKLKDSARKRIDEAAEAGAMGRGKS
jgi:hypothetical protein